MFKDCKTEVEKNQYKSLGKMKREFMAQNRKEDYEFYVCHKLAPYNQVFEDICNKVEIPEQKEGFIYYFAPRYQFDTTRGYRFENLTIDYEKILTSGLDALKYKEQDISNSFCMDYNKTIETIEKLALRIYEKNQTNRLGTYFARMQTEPAKHLEEAMQRILFINQLFWQMGHRLMGLGHLDWILEECYENDKDAGVLNQESTLKLIKDFLTTVHRFYWMKSNVLMGDTGQIIILGGLKDKNTYHCNDLTKIFIQAVQELNLPDPKVLLRVSRLMPKELIAKALECMESGVGSPLLSNDDVVVDKLVQYGVSEEDAYFYGTSACWEPLIIGKSISLNNLTFLTYPRVLQRVLDETSAYELDTMEHFMNAFAYQLEIECKRIKDFLSDFRYQYNPLLSVFTEGCFESRKDVSDGGAKYSNYGFTTVGLSNVVNALLNIDDKVYKSREMTIQEIRDELQSNFGNTPQLLDELKENVLYYGKDDEAVEKIANDIIKWTSAYTMDFQNYMGGKVKFGLSAPSYIDAAKDVPASFDGRKAGEPFGVHISSEKNNGYTEIVKFASELDYGENRFNGNVVDFMVSPSFIENNFDKFVNFLYAAITVGFFQLQMNVISSQKLIDAKKNPEKYPGLIVRVWGFSAYFNELPESYQDVLIQRALQNERRAS